MHKTKLTLAQIALFGMLGALTFGAKVAMSGLYNIEPVSLMVMLFAVVFGWKCLYPIYLYVLLEILLYGINLWNINYLYIWTVLAIIAILCRKNQSVWFWAAVAGIFGLLFGALCSIPYFLVGGWAAGFSYWVAGIPFDLIHCASNAILTALLLMPLYKLCCKLLGHKNKP